MEVEAVHHVYPMFIDHKSHTGVYAAHKTRGAVYYKRFLPCIARTSRFLQFVYRSVYIMYCCILLFLSASFSIWAHRFQDPNPNLLLSFSLRAL